MQRRFLFALSLSLLTALTVPEPLRGAVVSAAEAPKADGRLLGRLNSGPGAVRVIAGLRDGTTPPRILRARPDPAGEPDRRLRRLAAQRRVAEEIPPGDFQVRHYYGSFSMISGTVTRAGALALANRPDVEWVTLDGTRRPLQVTPTGSQVLIQSVEANALGLRGTGQAIAVLDTGVDYTIPPMGGGGFPNAKVIGGTDTADDDADPMDCDGHGTSVAGVAAGPTGVAPDARIVAVKVFGSGSPTNATCSDEAFDSDILAGIDYAITNRSVFGIGVVNLSLGGAFEDELDHGFCDSDVQNYTDSFDAAIAAGLAVVVASGNDAHSNAVSAPACVSSAISVGAVYADNRTSASWLDDSGGVQCTDGPIVPDQLACFSNSSTTLSVLAPGAFWRVTTKGSGIDFFSGTSAAAPAVAGAAALIRQARPGIPPASIAGILRATGAPLTDARNGITTPRLDALAAVQLAPSRFAGFPGTPVAIPDGASSASATLTLSGFAGSVAGIHVLVAIDHPDPGQLRLRLSAPDGTSMLLHDRAGTFEHPINAIYGKTDAPAQSLAVFEGHNPNGVWTLTVEDLVPGTAGRIRSFAITVLPGQPLAAIPADVQGRVLPLIAHVRGTKLFKSDIRIFNPAPFPRDFSLFFVPLGRSGAQASRATRTIGAGEVLALDDVISSEYGFSDSFGPITVTTTDTNFLVSGRNYTESANGTFGLAVPGPTTLPGLGAGGGTATANGLIKNAQYHTNVGFTEVSGRSVTVRMDVVNSDGAVIASVTGTAAPNTTFLITDIIANRSLPPTSNFRVDFTVTSAEGRIFPFATYVDDITGDSLFQPAVNPAATAEDIVLSQSAHVTGANQDFFRTNVYLTNLGAQPVTLTVSLIPLILTGPNPGPRSYTLQPGQTLEKVDVLASEFGLSDPSAAGLRIHPNGPARVAVSNNTFVQKFGGTFGFSISALAAARGAGPGRTLTAIQLDHTTALSGFRCNFGFAEVGGSAVTVRVTAKDGGTGAVLASKAYSAAANTLFQTSSADLFGPGNPASNFYLQFVIEGGAGRILAYATVNDNKSGDAIYIPAE